MTAAHAVSIAVTFTWLGMVLATSSLSPSSVTLPRPTALCVRFFRFMVGYGRWDEPHGIAAGHR